MTADEEHAFVSRILDASGRRIVEMAQRLSILEAEVEIFKPPVVPDDGSEEGNKEP